MKVLVSLCAMAAVLCSVSGRADDEKEKVKAEVEVEVSSDEERITLDPYRLSFSRLSSGSVSSLYRLGSFEDLGRVEIEDEFDYKPHRLSTRLYDSQPKDYYSEIMTSLQNENGDKKLEKMPRKNYFFIGDVESWEFTLLHKNDIDLTGVSSYLGYPETDDLGRTGGLELRFGIQGTQGELAATLSDQLFTRSYRGHDNTQELLEEVTLEVRGRKYWRPSDKRMYTIVGFSFTGTTQDDFIVTTLQNYLHTATGSTDRKTFAYDENQIYMNAIAGLGTQHKVFENDFVKATFTAEGEVAASSKFNDFSSFTARGALDFEINTWGSKEPDWYLKFYGEKEYRANGDCRSEYGGELFYRFRPGRCNMDLGVGVYKYGSDFDDHYNGGDSMNTGIFLRFSRSRSKRNKYSLFRN